MSMVIAGKELSEYTVDDLLLMCIRNNEPVVYTTDERVMRMRCIMSLRAKGLIDTVTEHIVTREIKLRVGSKHRISGSMGMDFPTGIIEVVWVGTPDESILASEDYRVLSDNDPDLSTAMWVAFKYTYCVGVDIDDYKDLTYCPADLLADHLSCR